MARKTDHFIDITDVDITDEAWHLSVRLCPDWADWNRVNFVAKAIRKYGDGCIDRWIASSWQLGNQTQYQEKEMATNDCPGANPKNADVLAAGCWAEHDDGSLLYIKGTENQQVVYELYDVAQKPPVSYTDAMREDAFKKAFSYGPTGTSKEKWLWHDKTPFPWNRVMKTFDRPRPMHADVQETLSAAARVAESLRLRAKQVEPEGMEHMRETVTGKGKGIMERLQAALDAFVGEK